MGQKKDYMLEAKTREHLCHIAEILGADITRWDIGAYPIWILHLDVPVSFDMMAEIVDYLREQNNK